MSLFALCALAMLGMLLYFPTNLAAPRHYLDSALDRRIPLIPAFVIPYLGLFPFLAVAAYLLVPSPFGRAFVISMAIAAYGGALLWYFFPTGTRRPAPGAVNGAYAALLRGVYRADAIGNAFPSSHVFYAVICGYWLIVTFPAYTLVIIPTAGVIALSTVFTKQHSIADVFGGVIVAIIALLSVRAL